MVKVKDDEARIAAQLADAAKSAQKVVHMIEQIASEASVAAQRATSEAARSGEADPDDEADAADARAVLAGIKAGEIETFPAEVAERLAAGDNPVKVFREFRGLSGFLLSIKVGISQPYLSQIETGKRDATFHVMARIALALDVSLDYLAPRKDELFPDEQAIRRLNAEVLKL